MGQYPWTNTRVCAIVVETCDNKAASCPLTEFTAPTLSQQRSCAAESTRTDWINSGCVWSDSTMKNNTHKNNVNPIKKHAKYRKGVHICQKQSPKHHPVDRRGSQAVMLLLIKVTCLSGHSYWRMFAYLYSRLWFWINPVPDLLCGQTSGSFRESCVRWPPPYVPHPPLPAFSTPLLLLSLDVGQQLQRCAQKRERSRRGVDGCQRAGEEQRRKEENKKNLSAGTSVKQVRQRGKRDRDEKTEPRGKRRRDFSTGTQSMRWGEEERGEDRRGNNKE